MLLLAGALLVGVGLGVGAGAGAAPASGTLVRGRQSARLDQAALLAPGAVRHMTTGRLLARLSPAGLLAERGRDLRRRRAGLVEPGHLSRASTTALSTTALASALPGTGPGDHDHIGQRPSEQGGVLRSPLSARGGTAFFEGVDDALPAELPMLHQVSGHHPLVVRLYTGCWYHEMPVERTAATWGFNDVASQIEAWNRAGVPMIVSLSYDPPITTEPPELSDEAVPSLSWLTLYARCAADFARRFGGLRELLGIDVTNEPDIPNESTSDGAMPLVQLAVVDGVEAAHRALPAHSHTVVGFSWAYATGPYDVALFSLWGTYGGATFDKDVGFVDMHIYPGTFAPEDPPVTSPICDRIGPEPTPAAVAFPPAVCARLASAPPGALTTSFVPTTPDAYYYSSYATVAYGVAYLRDALMPLAGLGEHVAIVIGETGYRSSGSGTTQDPEVPFFHPGNDFDQLEHLYGEWTAAWDLRSAPTNVAGFIWYELADHYQGPSSGATSYGSCTLPQPFSAVATNCVTGFGLYSQPAKGTYKARPVLCAYRSIIDDPHAADARPLAGISRYDATCPVGYSMPASTPSAPPPPPGGG